jgi:hypothetical protein
MQEIKIIINNYKLEEKLEEIYIYQDFIKKTLEVKYNDELNFPFNIEKSFIKKFSNQYKFQSKKIFDNLIDIKAKLSEDKNEIIFHYEFKKGYLK